MPLFIFFLCKIKRIVHPYPSPESTEIIKIIYGSIYSPSGCNLFYFNVILGGIKTLFTAGTAQVWLITLMMGVLDLGLAVNQYRQV